MKELVRKIIKVSMLLFMLIGVIFSLSNFSSQDLNAGARKGIMTSGPGGYYCGNFGDDCDILLD